MKDSKTSLIKKRNIFYKKEQEISLLIILVLLVMIFSVSSRSYFSVINFMIVLSNIAIIGITAVGLSFVVITGNMDISVGAVTAFAGSVVVVLDGIYPDITIFLKILVALVIGFVWGSINGFIVTKIGLNSVITTLAMMSLIRGVSYSITTKNSVLFNQPLETYTRKILFGVIPISVIYFLIIIIIANYVLLKTKFGKSIYAVGNNINSSKLMGLNTDRVQYWAFVISAICASLAGIILLGQISVGRADNATGNEFDALTIIILGGISIKGGRGKLIGVFIAVLIFISITNGLVHIGLTMFWKEIFKGVILILAVSIDIIRRRKSVFQHIG